MKKYLTLFTILSFLITNAQFEKGIIYLKDGNTEEGLIKVRNLGGIKYKENENSEAKPYTHTDLIGYDITEKGVKKYRYKKVGSDSPISMKVVRLGKINLYSRTIAKRDIVTGIKTSNSFIYFIEKDETTIRIGNKFNKKELLLLKNCPELLRKIKKKNFKRSDVYQIVNFYNTNCK